MYAGGVSQRLLLDNPSDMLRFMEREASVTDLLVLRSNAPGISEEHGISHLERHDFFDALHSSLLGLEAVRRGYRQDFAHVFSVGAFRLGDK